MRYDVGWRFFAPSILKMIVIESFHVPSLLPFLIGNFVMILCWWEPSRVQLFAHDVDLPRASDVRRQKMLLLIGARQINVLCTSSIIVNGYFIIFSYHAKTYKSTFKWRASAARKHPMWLSGQRACVSVSLDLGALTGRNACFCWDMRWNSNIIER